MRNKMLCQTLFLPTSPKQPGNGTHKMGGVQVGTLIRIELGYDGLNLDQVIVPHVFIQKVHKGFPYPYETLWNAGRLIWQKQLVEGGVGGQPALDADHPLRSRKKI